MTIILRRLITQLMGGVEPEEPHIFTELLNANFEIDKMLYFVAPDWWLPQMFKSSAPISQSGSQSGVVPCAPGQDCTTITKPGPQEQAGSGPVPNLDSTDTLTVDDQIGWSKANGNRPYNYPITEDSEPAL